MDYYIFRHGPTYFSKKGIPYGDQVETAEILKEGFPAIERLGKYLKGIKTDFNVTSPYLRCRQTVEIVSKNSDKFFEINNLLHDYDPRNETIEDNAKRITDFYNDLITHTPEYSSVAICTHGYPIAMLKDLVLTGKIDLSKINDYPETGVLTVIKNSTISEINFN